MKGPSTDTGFVMACAGVWLMHLAEKHDIKPNDKHTVINPNDPNQKVDIPFGAVVEMLSLCLRQQRNTLQTHIFTGLLCAVATGVAFRYWGA